MVNITRRHVKGVIVFMIVFSLCMLIMFDGYYLGWRAYARTDDFYSEKYACSLILEQQVACYRGCQFTTQGVFNLTHAPAEESIPLYRSCIELCKKEYYLEFDDSGAINLCRYQEV